VSGPFKLFKKNGSAVQNSEARVKPHPAADLYVDGRLDVRPEAGDSGDELEELPVEREFPEDRTQSLESIILELRRDVLEAIKLAHRVEVQLSRHKAQHALTEGGNLHVGLGGDGGGDNASYQKFLEFKQRRGR